ncbi:hypothetical protein BST81_16630 [Leptolyngbya sp. 'hensonii']|uniref:DUF6753 family protein n=1 Tax=Leptolyngbya sp. 'hensonii' TaxID=1922337 RepID=UPI00094F87F9|nr:DUF6753 family protein [Leptolyngbya sp. 'hensonii']OLP17417.1 hypothetical protein BST81_16630 [Leptolyngbya sp. 'hensonii']
MARDLNYFDELLAQMPVEYQAKLANTARKLGVPEGDTVYLFLLACHHIVALCDGIPAELRSIQVEHASKLRQAQGEYLKQMGAELQQLEKLKPILESAFLTGLDGIKDTLAMAERTAVAEQKRTISQIAREWARTQQIEALKHHWAEVAIPLTLLLTVVATLGMVVGLVAPRLLPAPPLAPRGPVRLTLQQAELLQWATGKDGKRARELLDWNRSSLDGNACLKLQALNRAAAQSTGITPSGVEAQGGCYLWVVPPTQRQFRQAGPAN